MPVDRAAQLKKQSAKERKKVATTDLAGGARPKIEEPEVVPQPNRQSFAAANQVPAAGVKSLAAGASTSTYAQAQKLGGIVGEAEASEHSEDESPEPERTQSTSSQKVKVESKADLKKRLAKERKDEIAFLLAEETAAKRERIIRRFLMTIGIGFILDAVKGDGKAAPAGKPEKKQKKDKASKNGHDSEGFGRSVQKSMDVLAGPFAMFMLGLAIFAMRMGESGYRGSARTSVDYYEVMGVPRDAGVLDVRKAYKRLALTWHPDKHPDCEACPEKFALISEANEVLSNPERRKAYDQRSNSDGVTRSEASTELTADDFAAKVLRSNEIWVVQVYDPSDDGLSSFHPIWEDVAHSHRGLARFGRLDMSQHSAVLPMLPQRVLASPTIFRLGRGLLPEVFVPAWQGDRDQGAAPLARFVTGGYPQAKHLGSDASAWWKQERPRVLLVGPNPGARGAKKDYGLEAQHVAHTWADFFDFASAEAGAADKLDGLEPSKGGGWSFALKPGGNKAPQRVEVDDPAQLASQLQLTLEVQLGDQAPFVTVRNLRQLCEAAGGAGHYNVRTFCLVMVDTPDASVAKMVEQLESSRIAYRQELKELSSSDEDEVTEEIFRVQPVRIATSASRLPWRPDCPNMAAFGEIWGKVERAPVFVVELESRRVAAVKSKNFDNLFQEIAYEDLKFTELPETAPSVFHSLPDPELPLSAVLRRVLTTGPGALFALLVLAAATAVLPELEVPAAAGATGASLTFFLICWPAACRRFLSWMTF